MSRSRLPQVDDLFILREPPYDAVPRNCSACERQYLDDDFAHWFKFYSEYYVLWYNFGGRPDRRTKVCSFLPLNSQIKYLQSTQKHSMEKSPDWFEDWLLLRLISNSNDAIS